MSMFKTSHPSAIRRKQSGFTLVEMLVAVGVFSFVMVIAIGSLVSIIDANRKARTQQIVLNNLNAAIEAMSRDIREGTEWQIQNANTFRHISLAGDEVVYTISGDNRLIRSNDGGGTWLALTAANVTVHSLAFQLIEHDPSNPASQPKVQITVQGQAGGQDRTASNFNIQTIVSQRLKNITGLPGVPGTCRNDVALVVDASGSICSIPGQSDGSSGSCPNPTELELLKASVTSFLDGFTLGPANSYFAFVDFKTDAHLVVPLTPDLLPIQNAINVMNALPQDRTNMAGGILLGTRELVNNGRPNYPKYIFLISDGLPSAPSDANGQTYLNPGYFPGSYQERSELAEQVAQFADDARAQGITIIVVGVALEQVNMADPDTGQSISSRQFMEQHVADYPPPSGTQRYLEVNDFNQLGPLLDGFTCDNLDQGGDFIVQPF